MVLCWLARQATNDLCDRSNRNSDPKEKRYYWTRHRIVTHPYWVWVQCTVMGWEAWPVQLQ